MHRVWHRIQTLAGHLRQGLGSLQGVRLHDTGVQLCGIVTFTKVRDWRQEVLAKPEVVHTCTESMCSVTVSFTLAHSGCVYLFVTRALNGTQTQMCDVRGLCMWSLLACAAPDKGVPCGTIYCVLRTCITAVSPPFPLTLNPLSIKPSPIPFPCIGHSTPLHSTAGRHHCRGGAGMASQPRHQRVGIVGNLQPHALQRCWAAGGCSSVCACVQHRGGGGGARESCC